MGSLSRKQILAIGIVVVIMLLGVATYAFWQKPIKQPPSSDNKQSSSVDLPDDSKKDQPEAPVQESPKEAKLYYIALEDQGRSGKKIGCGDSLVAVNIDTASTDQPIKSALDTLLKSHQKDYGQSGLYNALYQSDLKIDKIEATKEAAVVYLTGKIVQSGSCDGPRIEAQLLEAVKHASGADKVDIFVNGRPLSEVLSQK